ncbi:MAG: hypothetical protein JWM30_2930 [Burkholderia sp.]|jgi:hypothetical protein|nr:hypothetical protein [Burkholderia sp.]
MTVKAPQGEPLEEQRDALLARIHASREAYRLQMHTVEVSPPAPTMHELMDHSQPHPFPRSQTMRWLLGHPLVIAGGVAALLVIGPRRAVNGVARVGPLVSSAAGMLTMTLQDPAKMRVAARGVAALANMVRARR